jgi:hypothetical protein
MKAIYAMIKDIQAGSFELDSEFAYEGYPVSSF